MRFTVDPHKHVVQVPLPVRICAHLADPFLADLCGKQRAKSVPPTPNRFVADVDAAFVQKILNIPQRERKTHIHHHNQADDLWARFKVPGWRAFSHVAKLRNHPARLKLVLSDSALA